MSNKLKSRIIRFFEGTINQMTTRLKVGMPAPDFTLPDQNEQLFTLSENKGKKVILYFYPKDNTSGCTLQSCNLRDHYDELTRKGYEVVGISNDDVVSHQKFIADFSLPYKLLADTEKKIVKLYDVYGEKTILGKKMFGIIRTTFVIDEVGVISRIISDVDTGNHTAQILQ